VIGYEQVSVQFCFHFSADDLRELNKVCDSLVGLEITREELLEQHEAEVDSTTEDIDSPVKKPKLTPKSEKKTTTSRKPKASNIQEKKKLALSKVEAAKSRAKEIFREMPSDSDLDDDSEHEGQGEMEKQVKEQEKVIEMLRRQLQEKSK